MAQEPTFLYVEDDAISCEVMQMLLEHRLNYTRITIFEDSADFLNRLENLSEAPTVFFLDIHVRPHDGFEMLEMIRNHKQFADATVVAVTASVMNEEVEALQIAGFNGVISKPIDPDTFPEVVKTILNGGMVW